MERANSQDDDEVLRRVVIFLTKVRTHIFCTGVNSEIENLRLMTQSLTLNNEVEQKALCIVNNNQKRALKKLLTSNDNFVKALIISVQFIVKILITIAKDENLRVLYSCSKYYNNFINCVDTLVAFLKSQEKELRILIINNTIEVLFIELIHIITTEDLALFKYETFYVNMSIVMFKITKHVTYARNCALKELLTKLQHFYKVMKVVERNELFESSYYENLLMTLEILKKILTYRFLDNKLPSFSSEKDKTLVLRNLLHNMISLVPFYLKVVLEECINLTYSYL